MRLKGRLVDIVRDLLTGVFRITFEVRAIPSGIDALREEDLSLNITKWRDRRSITANAYYWVIVAKIADAINAPQPVVHNMLLRRYGVLDTIDGETMTVFIPDTDEAEEQALNDELRHMRPTSHTRAGKDGRMWRAYRLIKGSSKYDSKEFSTLLDGAVSEAKEMGLETLPEEELERMMSDYEKHHGH